MRKIFGAICLSLLVCGPAQAQDSPLVQVMKDVRADVWDAAFDGAADINPIAEDIVMWRYLRAGQGNFDQYQDFVRRNAGWPGMDRVLMRGEATLGEASHAQVLAWFEGRAPLTGLGALALAQALEDAGQADRAHGVIQTAWRRVPMKVTEAEAIQVVYGPLLADLHEERLDMLLWEGQFEAARALLPLVDDGWKALAEARIALRLRHNGVDALIAAIPDELSDHPGLAYERFVWRDRAGLEESAAELAIAQGGDNLGRPEDWGNRRRSVARQLMRNGENRLAYDLAASHGLPEGSNYADLEWLAGYIALRKLDDPARALQHFQNFRAAVWTPISVGRAGYWQGRAYEALGDTENAQAAYAMGAAHQTSFYGQLAAERAGLPMDPALAETERFPDWRQAGFVNTSVVQAALMFQAAGERNLAEWFLVHITKGRPREEFGQLIDMVLSLDEPHLAVRIAKEAAQNGHVIMHGYFPLHPMAGEDLGIPPELALSIARRESEFDPDVTSPAGARGLMQLMPGTAQLVSDQLNISYRGSAALSDWPYNVQLGSTYLDGLIEEFGDSYVLVAAGYNAGPNRPRRWVQRYGDPRNSRVDAVDWVEHVPFRETRNYIMRVMESLPVYRARLAGRPVALNLSAELRCSC